MDVNNTIRLRLRFYKDVEENIILVQEKFKNYSKSKSKTIKINICDDHIWLFIIGKNKQYWSPHLHLQFEHKGENLTHIRGLFGPNQTLWTFFMFLHFIVAGIFTIFGIIAYSNYVLKQSYSTNLIIMGLMLSVWLLLYFIAKQIRWKGNNQMNELENLFLVILENKTTNQAN